MAAFFLSAAPAAAASTACDDLASPQGYDEPISDNVSPLDTSISNGCEVGSTNNDSEAQVNLDTMFGFNDWDQIDDLGFGSLGDGYGDGTTSGTIDLSSFDWTGIANLMLVFKDGQDTPEVYVGYLIENGATSVDYTTPFLNTQSSNAKQISHIKAYVRATSTTTDTTTDTTTTDTTTTTDITPEPTLLTLLGGGLIVAARRLRRRQTV